MTSRVLIFRCAAACALVQAAAPPARAIIAPPPSVIISSVVVKEGDAGMTMFTAQVTLGQPATQLEVDITAAPASATPDDYVFDPVRLTLMPGVSQNVSGFVVGDRAFEGDETFFLQAAPAQSSTMPPGYFFPQNGVVTITDDDLDNAPHVRALGVTAPEGNAGWHVVEAQVQLAPAVTSAVSVDYAFVRGTPYSLTVPWGDYRPGSGTLTFLPGETTKTISVEVNGDGAWEPDARFGVELSNVHRALIDGPAGDVVLVNDDAPTVVTIADAQVEEGGSGKRLVSVHVGFAPPTPPLATVRVDVVGGTARAGEDFVGQSLLLYPPPGSTSMTFGITVLSDMTAECDEGVVIAYQGLATGDETKKEAKLLILDDDGGPAGAGSCPDPFATRSEPLVTDAGAEPTADGGPPPAPDAGAGSDASAERTTPPVGGGCAVGGDQSRRGDWPGGLALLFVSLGAAGAAGRRGRRS
jgi:hypothetical protein